MGRVTGILDNVQILDSSDVDITQNLGHIIGASYDFDNKTEKHGSINQGSKYAEMIDGVVDIRPSLVINPVDFQNILKLIGTVTVDTGWSWEWSDRLPEFTMKGNITDTGTSGDYAEISNIKWSECTIKISKNNPIEFSFDGIAKDFQVKTGALTGSLPSAARLYYLDGYIKLNGTVVGVADDLTIKLSRNASAERGIEQVASGSKRKPTEIIEKMKDITFDGVIEITDSDAWKLAINPDATSTPYTIPDGNRTNISLEIVMDNVGTITISNASTKVLSAEKKPDGEIRTATISGIAIQIAASGG